MPADKPHYRVFISSTYLDNVERRKTVEDAVLAANMQPVGMERFTASDQPTVEECQRLARECDVYVGIVAHRYGWIPEGHAVSITELEYDAAKKLSRLMFRIDPKIPVVADEDYDDGPDRWVKQQKLDEFRDKYAADQMPAMFTETTLGTRVLLALQDWRSKRECEPQPTSEPVAVAHDSREIERYRVAADARHASLELAGFKTRLRVPIDLAELYVPLHANVDLRGLGEAEFADASDADKHLRASEAVREISLLEAFREAGSRQRRGLVILGDPGSGKTTHLKRLLLWCLREGSGGLGLGHDMLPVFLPLRELTDLSIGLEAFIEQELESPHLKMPAGFGARLLDRGHLLLLFDGLDEVADTEQRVQVARWIEEAARARPSCFPVVTCRFAGYRGEARLDAEFLELHLRPLTREQSEAFIRNWYRVVETGLAREPGQGEVTARTRAEDLVGHLQGTDFRAARMVEMTRNPLLLANLCLVHRDRGALPRGRARLYEECVDVLLERWREGKGMPVRVTAEAGRRALQPAALWMHGKENRTRASAEELSPILEPAMRTVQWEGGTAVDFLRAVRDDSGLLTGWGQDQFGFMHLGFQEYLAACEVRRRALEGDEAVLAELAERYGQSWWQEVILLLVALGNPSPFEPFMREVVKRQAFAEAPELLGLLLEDAAEVSQKPFIELLRESAKDDRALWARQESALGVLEQLGASEALARLEKKLEGHPSPAVQRWLKQRDKDQLITTENGRVPLVAIPAGTFTMGSPESEVGRFSDEGPQHQVTIASFFLGQGPVTNEQYARFLEANPKAKEPEYWGARRFNGGRQPVVGVSWEEARRFAQWAGGRLPTEAEWEYAARAGTETAYWCGEKVGQNRANCDGCGSRWDNQQTSPVDAFAANPFGLHDVHGNVWEWVEDCWHGDYENAPSDGRARGKESGGDCGRRVVRGGSWDDRPEGLRSAARSNLYPDWRSLTVGFRLAQDR